MSGIHHFWISSFGAPPPAAPVEQLLFTREQSALPGYGGMSPSAARTSFLAKVPSPIVEDVEAVAIGAIPTRPTSTPTSTNGRAIWGGAGRMRMVGNFSAGQVVENTLGANGRFNTWPVSGGDRWAETADTIEFTTPSPASAFGVMLTDLGDFSGQLTFEFYSGLTLVKTYTTPAGVVLDTSEQAWFSYRDPSVTFDRITVLNSDFNDGVGFDGLICGTAIA